MPTLSATEGILRLNSEPISEAYGGCSSSHTGGMSSITKSSADEEVTDESEEVAKEENKTGASEE